MSNDHETFFSERSEPEGLNILDVGAEYGIDRKIKGYSPIHNRKYLLLGRLLFMVFSK